MLEAVSLQMMSNEPTDNGIGIQQEHLTRSSKCTFARRKLLRLLGLFIVSEVIDKNGGNISVNQNLANNPNFEILIPTR